MFDIYSNIILRTEILRKKCQKSKINYGTLIQSYYSCYKYNSIQNKRTKIMMLNEDKAHKISKYFKLHFHLV